MEGFNSRVDQSWICCGVSTRPFERDCLSPLHEKGPTCCNAIDTHIQSLKKEVADLLALTTLRTRPLFQDFNYLDVYLL